MRDCQVAHRSDTTHHQREHLSQPLMFRTRRGQRITVRRAMAAKTVLLADLLSRLNQYHMEERTMNSQVLVSPAARVEPWHKDAPRPELHTDMVALHSATTRVDITIDSRFAANVQVVRPAPRIHSIADLKHAAWMVPDGDGWAEVYSDGDGWPVWDVEIWPPAVSYGDGWVVPNGDGWSPYESHDSRQESVSL
jgi:hypothetical protein